MVLQLLEVGRTLSQGLALGLIQLTGYVNQPGGGEEGGEMRSGSG